MGCLSLKIRALILKLQQDIFNDFLQLMYDVISCPLACCFRVMVIDQAYCICFLGGLIMTATCNGFLICESRKCLVSCLAKLTLGSFGQTVSGWIWTKVTHSAGALDVVYRIDLINMAQRVVQFARWYIFRGRINFLSWKHWWIYQSKLPWRS